jgi:hypothetical protein
MDSQDGSIRKMEPSDDNQLIVELCSMEAVSVGRDEFKKRIGRAFCVEQRSLFPVFDYRSNHSNGLCGKRPHARPPIINDRCRKLQLTRRLLTCARKNLLRTSCERASGLFRRTEPPAPSTILIVKGPPISLQKRQTLIRASCSRMSRAVSAGGSSSLSSLPIFE